MNFTIQNRMTATKMALKEKVSVNYGLQRTSFYKKNLILSTFISDEIDGEDSSNSKMFRSITSDKKMISSKDSMNSTDHDIMVNATDATDISEHKLDYLPNTFSILFSHCCRSHQRVKNKANKWVKKFSNCCQSQRPKNDR